jgi:hypothetical protein
MQRVHFPKVVSQQEQQTFWVHRYSTTSCLSISLYSTIHSTTRFSLCHLLSCHLPLYDYSDWYDYTLTFGCSLVTRLTVPRHLCLGFGFWLCPLYQSTERTQPSLPSILWPLLTIRPCSLGLVDAFLGEPSEDRRLAGWLTFSSFQRVIQYCPNVSKCTLYLVY